MSILRHSYLQLLTRVGLPLYCDAGAVVAFGSTRSLFHTPNVMIVKQETREWWRRFELGSCECAGRVTNRNGQFSRGKSSLPLRDLNDILGNGTIHSGGRLEVVES